MTIIGSFIKKESGFLGTLRTLALDTNVKIVPLDLPGDAAPNFRIFAGSVEIGAGWNKAARDSGRPYISVKIDDPTFPTAIYASLFEAEEPSQNYNLVWSRAAPG